MLFDVYTGRISRFAEGRRLWTAISIAFRSLAQVVRASCVTYPLK